MHITRYTQVLNECLKLTDVLFVRIKCALTTPIHSRVLGIYLAGPDGISNTLTTATFTWPYNRSRKG